ncbi:MAG: rod-binding protein [Armatimonadetes bacterium]|nr:rod-binding protein [Armatimonadota bacterium]
MRIDSVMPAQTAINSKDDKQLKKACQDFEAIFTGFLLKAMRKTVQKSELFGSNQEEDMFRDMMDDEIAKSSSQRGSMGIADLLYKQLTADADRKLHNETRGGTR